MKQISEIMDPRLLLVVSVAGFALMLAGFAGYVANPSVVFQSAFIVGVVLLAYPGATTETMMVAVGVVMVVVSLLSLYSYMR